MISKATPANGYAAPAPNLDRLTAADRILVLGAPGCGKTRLARWLGDALGLPCHELDELYWRPGWKRVTAADFEQAQHLLVAGPRWIIEGLHFPTVGLRLRRAQTVVLLDLPTRLVLWQFLCRGLARRIGRTESLPAVLQSGGFRTWLAGWRPELRIWRTVLHFHSTTMPKLRSLLEQEKARGHEIDVIVLQSNSDCDALRRRLRGIGGGDSSA